MAGKEIYEVSDEQKREAEQKIKVTHRYKKSYGIIFIDIILIVFGSILLGIYLKEVMENYFNIEISYDIHLVFKVIIGFFIGAGLSAFLLLILKFVFVRQIMNVVLGLLFTYFMYFIIDFITLPDVEDRTGGFLNTLRISDPLWWWIIIGLMVLLFIYLHHTVTKDFDIIEFRGWFRRKPKGE